MATRESCQSWESLSLSIPLQVISSLFRSGLIKWKRNLFFSCLMLKNLVRYIKKSGRIAEHHQGVQSVTHRNIRGKTNILSPERRVSLCPILTESPRVILQGKLKRDNDVQFLSDITFQSPPLEVTVDTHCNYGLMCASRQKVGKVLVGKPQGIQQKVEPLSIAGLGAVDLDYGVKSPPFHLIWLVKCC